MDSSLLDRFFMCYTSAGSGQLLHDLGDLLLQGGFGEGLHYVASGTALGCHDDVFLACLGRHHQDRDVLEGGIGLDGFEEIKTVHVRHVDVTDHEVVAVGLEHLQGDGAILSIEHISIAQFLEETTDNAPHG